MPRSPESYPVDPSLNMRRTQSEVYYAREFRSEYAYIYSRQVEDFLFRSTDRRLREAGITEAAQKNWMHTIPRGILPSLNAQGQPAQFDSFHQFEDYLHDLFKAAIRDKKITRQQFKG